MTDGGYLGPAPEEVTVRCQGCHLLWAAEARAGGWPVHATVGPVLPHPLCPRGHDGHPDKACAERPVALAPSAGPLLAERLVHDPGLDLWMSDVVLTTPVGPHGHAAVVGGGLSRDRETSRLIGWAEAVERRCAMRRPRGAVRRLPNGLAEEAAPRSWHVAGKYLATGESTWIPLVDATLTGTTDTTGMAAFPTRDGALRGGLREWGERAALAQWWSGGKGVRCRDHTDLAASLLATSATVASGATCQVWHTSWGPLRVAGCLLITPTNQGPRAIFGSGAAADTASAVVSAYHEALQLHVTAGVIRGPNGAARFGPQYVGAPLSEEFLDRFFTEFPVERGCTTVPEDSERLDTGLDGLLATAGPRTAAVDCADPLADALGLHVVRVVCPDLPRWSARTTSPTGLTPAFL
ncbi:YcaO-like family protein [Streptomyces sp. NPDC023327]|uniref:YcaO-like family protein n=1 Tax=Streptomyces sp. NPDC023327 TaxID=3157088 RepID=UPI0033F14814